MFEACGFFTNDLKVFGRRLQNAIMDCFRMTEDQAHKVMITAHRRGVCVVAVFTKDVAETKATRATDAGRAKGYPLLFTTEPEE